MLSTIQLIKRMAREVAREAGRGTHNQMDWKLGTLEAVRLVQEERAKTDHSDDYSAATEILKWLPPEAEMPSIAPAIEAAPLQPEHLTTPLPDGTAVIAELQVWANKFDELAQEYEAMGAREAAAAYKGAEFILEQRITELRQSAQVVEADSPAETALLES